MNNMSILIIGLGSMGRRRIRCLKALGVKKITGFDINKPRAREVAKDLGISLIDSIDDYLRPSAVDCVIISVSPEAHDVYLRKCVEESIPCFVEASVLIEGLSDIVSKNNMNHKIAPSCTLCFHPAIKMISKIVSTNELGDVSNFILHSGQYLPDWHPYEKVEDYYVSKKQTGGAREIVPFELTWLTKIFGFPKSVKSFVAKTIDIKGAENIDDTYNCIFDFGRFLGVLVVDVVARRGTRSFELIFSNGHLIWNWENDYVEIIRSDGLCERITYAKGLLM